MATDDVLPRERIKRVLVGQATDCIHYSAELLAMLSTSLTKIVGADGFQVLMLRVLRRVGKSYYWLQYEPRNSEDLSARFRMCFDGQSLSDSQSACILLFTTLFEILALLIGVHLTTIIFENAFGSAQANGRVEEHDNG